MSVLHTPHKTVRFADGSVGEVLKAVGVASYCSCAAKHEPKPLRFVWHHLLPVACGGKSTPDNLVMACDNCHYTIHALLTTLKNGGGTIKYPLSRYKNTLRYNLALQGYTAAVAAGTVDKIPNEGGGE
jgi:hypothetical protein